MYTIKRYVQRTTEIMGNMGKNSGWEREQGFGGQCVKTDKETSKSVRARERD